MTLQVKMADGSVYEPDNNARQAAITVGAGNIQPEAAPARTRLQIVTELESVEGSLKVARDHVAELEQDAKDLAFELRWFGVKKRGPRKG